MVHSGCPFTLNTSLAHSILDLLEEKKIRDYAGYQVLCRGLSYYRAGRVEVETATDYEARCRVRGTRYYYVNLWYHNNELGAMCTCPHADSGYFCKHMTASALAVRDYLNRYGNTSWKTVLSNTLQEGVKSSRKKKSKPYWFFISLQVAEQGWELSPYRFWINRVPEGILPDDPRAIE